MTDNEMLEAVAEVAGLNIYGAWLPLSGYFDGYRVGSINGDRWDPRTDDGDSVRLAVDLGIATLHYPVYEPVKHGVLAKKPTLDDVEPSAYVPYDEDPRAATRRAIFLCAVEICRAMNKEKQA